MPLSANQRRFLRSLAHPLRPVVLVGEKGLTETLLAELDRALTTHELVKVRVAAEDREARDAAITELASRSGAELVQRVGHVATLYRRDAEDPRIELPR